MRNKSAKESAFSKVAPFLPAAVLGILFWELASVQWHVDQRDAVGLTEVHGQVQLPGNQRVVAVFTLASPRRKMRRNRRRKRKRIWRDFSLAWTSS